MMVTLQPSPRRIAVLRANGLGDFLLATPALRALGKAFPAADITYLSQPWLQRFIAGRYPYIHCVEAIPPYPGLRAADPDHPDPNREADAFFQRMVSRRYDLAIQMHGGGRYSNPFVARLGARHTLGLCTADAPLLDTNLTYQYYQHESLRYLELVSLVGVKADGLETDLPVLRGDIEALRDALPAGLGRYGVLHSGAGDARRRWPVERWARVAEHLHQKHRLPLVLTGRADEASAVAELRTRCRASTINLAGRLDLGAMAALLRGAALMVTNDTGPAHMAFALDVPSVIIYWCGNLITAGPMQRRRHRPVLSWTLECPRCHTTGRCDCGESWVAGATLDEVIAQADDLLAGE
ncbi:MAG: glycosyltransferase family 9 protein [Anaerolineae bacterium]